MPPPPSLRAELPSHTGDTIGLSAPTTAFPRGMPLLMNRVIKTLRVFSLALMSLLGNGLRRQNTH